MQTRITEQFLKTPQGQEANDILRSCVHCGFCSATCPTYQLLGDELDGPRGRIYLVKQLLEGKGITAKTQTHLDRCLTCRACETTCPSGVQYARLADIGREMIEQPVRRPLAELAKDISEVLRDETLPWERIRPQQKKIAFHSSCTLQHGQQLDGVVEGILRKAGFKLTPVADAHLCCGSAGTYSILQAELSQQLLSNKLQALQAGEPELIATANVGCQLHLASRANRPVKHWIEVLDEALG